MLSNEPKRAHLQKLGKVFPSGKIRTSTNLLFPSPLSLLEAEASD
jgi:hypothetical protein